MREYDAMDYYMGRINFEKEQELHKSPESLHFFTAITRCMASCRYQEDEYFSRAKEVYEFIKNQRTKKEYHEINKRETSEMNVFTLKSLLKKHRLPRDGKKKDFVQRLVDHNSAELGILSEDDTRAELQRLLDALKPHEEYFKEMILKFSDGISPWTAYDCLLDNQFFISIHTECVALCNLHGKHFFDRAEDEYAWSVYPKIFKILASRRHTGRYKNNPDRGFKRLLATTISLDAIDFWRNGENGDAEDLTMKVTKALSSCWQYCLKYSDEELKLASEDSAAKVPKDDSSEDAVVKVPKDDSSEDAVVKVPKDDSSEDADFKGNIPLTRALLMKHLKEMAGRWNKKIEDLIALNTDEDLDNNWTSKDVEKFALKFEKVKTAKKKGKENKRSNSGGVENMKKKKKSNNNALIDEINAVPLPIDCPVFDNCDIIRKKINDFFTIDGVTKAAFLRATECSSSTLKRFLAQDGKGRGGNKKIYARAYRFFEQKRILDGDEKSRARIEAERVFSKDGGYPLIDNEVTLLTVRGLDTHIPNCQFDIDWRQSRELKTKEDGFYDKHAFHPYTPYVDGYTTYVNSVGDVKRTW